MTEATYTDAEYAAATQVNLLAIPWCLNVNNPAAIAAREARQTVKLQKVEPAGELKHVLRPAKSVATMPAASEPDTPAPVATPRPAAAKTRSSKVNGAAIIRVLVTDFGHKVGSKAEKKSAGLRDGMTVAEYMANDLGYAGKWHGSHISHCLGKGFIKLED